MVYNYQEVLKIFGNRNNIEVAIKNRKIYRIDRGIYSDNKLVNPLIVVSKKYPNAIITMDSAFYYYDLTDVIPNKVYLATNRKSNCIKNEKIEQIFMSKEILMQGKTQVKIDECLVNIYDKERLLIELIRKKSKIPFDYYKEIINNYREIKDELDMYKIEEYVSLFKNDVSLYDILQREVF